MNALAMSSPTLAQRYIDAWNDHDGNGLVSCFAADGSYSDPLAGDNLTPDALAAHAARLWVAFPDLQLDMVSIDSGSGQGIAAQWIMRGTHLGPYRGHQATGRPITLPGA